MRVTRSTYNSQAASRSRASGIHSASPKSNGSFNETLLSLAFSVLRSSFTGHPLLGAMTDSTVGDRAVTCYVSQPIDRLHPQLALVYRALSPQRLAPRVVT